MGGVAARQIAYGSGSSDTGPGYGGLYIEALEPNVEVSMSRIMNVSEYEYVPATLYYSIDNGRTWNWFDVDDGNTSVSLTRAGDRVYFKAGGEPNLNWGYPGWRSFVVDGRFNVGGNIMSLVS